MHILMLAPTLPFPPHQGGALRNFGLIHGLSTAGHTITLLCFHNDSPPVASTPLAHLCHTVVTVPPPARPSSRRLLDLLMSGQPDLARRLESPALTESLTALLAQQRFDLVQFEGLEMAGWLPLVRQHQPHASLCYDAHNAEYVLQQAIFAVDRETPRRWPSAAYSLLQSRRIYRFEREVCANVNCVLAVSDEDAAALRPFRPDGCVHVIPNGIFIDQYDQVEEQLDLGEHVLTFTGKMDYRPNVDAMLWFSSAVLPRVHREIPDARLYIVGQKPHPRLERLRENPAIAITGWVTAVQPFLHATDVYIAPLRMGSGTRLKILEAMATHCAVVATTTAVAGLPPQVTSAMVVADEPESMATAIIALLRDPDRRAALGEAAAVAVRQHYDWSILMPRLLYAYEDCGIG